MLKADSRPNPWIALGGLAVLAALAIGLLTNGAATVSAQYGPPEPPAITDVTTKPAVGKYKKGFKVSFKAAGQVDYRIYVIDKIDNRIILARGSANGPTTGLVGRKLKPGKYWLFAGRKSVDNEKNQLGLPVYYDNLYQDFFVTK